MEHAKHGVEYIEENCPYKEDAEKWREIEPRIVKPKWVKNKDREIIIRLKNWIADHHYDCPREIQLILEGKEK